MLIALTSFACIKLKRKAKQSNIVYYVSILMKYIMFTTCFLCSRFFLSLVSFRTHINMLILIRTHTIWKHKYELKWSDWLDTMNFDNQSVDLVLISMPLLGQSNRHHQLISKWKYSSKTNSINVIFNHWARALPPFTNG